MIPRVPVCFITNKNSISFHSETAQSYIASLNCMIERACRHCFEKNRFTKTDIATRNTVRLHLQNYLRNFSCNNSAAVYPFGSSTNGFGFRNSDIDFFVRGVSGKTVVKALKCHRGYSNVKIVRCRVPLVAFRHNLSGLNGDLSFHNYIGVQNSQMLYRYSTICKRCCLLVCALKYLTKCCKIADASKGFLSSYAYTIMAIHYLQQLEVPVLPILQEIKPPDFDYKNYEQYVVDGFNAYYFSQDNKSLAKVWPGFGKNQQRISELLVGMLRYYAEEFDYGNHAVCIHKSVAPRISKKNKSRITILDPFENERDLCAPLLKSSNEIIRNVFSNAYRHFTTAPSTLMTSDELLDYFFNPKVLLGDNAIRHWYFAERNT